MKNENKVLIGVMLIVIAAGLCLSCYYCRGFNFVNEGVYFKLAKNIVSYRAFTLNGTDPTAIKLPGYPLMLAPLVALGANIYILKFSNFFAVCIAVLLVFKISSRFFGKNAAIISSFLVLLYPRFIANATYLCPEAYGSVVFLYLLLVLFDKNNISLGKVILLGGGLGFAALTIPGYIAALPVFAFRIIKKNRQKAAGRCMIFLIAFFFIFGGWILRNYIHFNSLSPAESAGIRLLQGNSKGMNHYTRETDISEYRRKTKGMTPMEKSAYYRNAAINYVSSNKYQSIKLFFKKFIRYFAFTEGYRSENDWQYIHKIVIHISWGALLVLFILRLILLKKYRLLDF